MIEKSLFLLLHFGVPLLLMLLGMRRPRSLAGAVAFGAFSLAAMMLLFVWGQWAIAGSVHGRWLPALAGVGILATVVIRSPGLPMRPPGAWSGIGSLVLATLAFWLGFGALVGWQGLRYAEPSFELHFPLAQGRYYIASGGSSKIVNNHMRNFPNAQQFAIDINKLGPLDGAARPVMSSRNEDHYIFGEPVHAPCQGRVIRSRHQVPDNVGSNMSVAPEHGLGNFVELLCGRYRVTLAHLQANTVNVADGEMVESGQLLGAVGNSGFSQEPHLHLQTAVGGENGRQVGVAMSFDGQRLVRNDVLDR